MLDHIPYLLPEMPAKPQGTLGYLINSVPVRFLPDHIDEGFADPIWYS
jgi:hypothetical protein